MLVEWHFCCVCCCHAADRTGALSLGCDQWQRRYLLRALAEGSHVAASLTHEPHWGSLSLCVSRGESNKWGGVTGLEDDRVHCCSTGLLQHHPQRPWQSLCSLHAAYTCNYPSCRLLRSVQRNASGLTLAASDAQQKRVLCCSAADSCPAAALRSAAEARGLSALHLHALGLHGGVFSYKPD